MPEELTDFEEPVSLEEAISLYMDNFIFLDDTIQYDNDEQEIIEIEDMIELLSERWTIYVDEDYLEPEWCNEIKKKTINPDRLPYNKREGF